MVVVPWSFLRTLPYPNVENPIILRVIDSNGVAVVNGTTLTMTSAPVPAIDGAFLALAFASLGGVASTLLRRPRAATTGGGAR